MVCSGNLGPGKPGRGPVRIQFLQRPKVPGGAGARLGVGVRGRDGCSGGGVGGHPHTPTCLAALGVVVPGGGGRGEQGVSRRAGATRRQGSCPFFPGAMERGRPDHWGSGHRGIDCVSQEQEVFGCLHDPDVHNCLLWLRSVFCYTWFAERHRQSWWAGRHAESVGSGPCVACGGRQAFQWPPRAG